MYLHVAVHVTLENAIKGTWKCKITGLSMRLCRNSNTCEGHVTDHATRITRNCRLGKLKQMTFRQMKKSTEECDTNFFITVRIKKRFLLACLLRDSLHNRRFKNQVRRMQHFAQNAAFASAHKDLLCRLVKEKSLSRNCKHKVTLYSSKWYPYLLPLDPYFHSRPRASWEPEHQDLVLVLRSPGGSRDENALFRDS